MRTFYGLASFKKFSIWNFWCRYRYRSPLVPVPVPGIDLLAVKTNFLFKNTGTGAVCSGTGSDTWYACVDFQKELFPVSGSLFIVTRLKSGVY
jgi:hypothetical protein